MKVKPMLGALLLSLALSTQTLADATPEATLDSLHKAGADANQTAFTALLAEDVVFLGMDGANRLEGAEVRDFVSENFAGGNSWTFRSNQREVRFSGDGAVAWFDEALEHGQLGSGRGTGVLIRSAEGWKIAQYNLTMPMANGAMSTSAALGTQAVAPVAAPATETQPKKRCMMTSHKTNTRAKC